MHLIFRYKGQAGYITDTDLIYCQHRVYDPKAGRWLTRDPIGVDGGINSYEYCDGNPVMNIDPSGLDTRSQLLALMFGPCPPALDRNDDWFKARLGDPLGTYGRVPRTPPNYHLDIWVGKAKAMAERASNTLNYPVSTEEQFMGNAAAGAEVMVDVWFAYNVMPTGAMDFKNHDRKKGHGFDAHYMELVDYGNFNYGVIGRALGYSEKDLMSMAGNAAYATGRGHFASQTGPPTYGDQVRDNYFIRMGFQYYDRVYGGRQ